MIFRLRLKTGRNPPSGIICHMFLKGPSQRIIAEPVELPVTPDPEQPAEPEPAEAPPVVAVEPEPAKPA
jgi:hypothetical protein